MTHRIIARLELVDGRECVLWVIESDLEYGAPTFRTEDLLPKISELIFSIAEAEFKSGTIGRVFTSGLIDGERRFIEWRREGEEKLRAERKPERLPAVLLAAEQVGESLAAYGSASAVGGTQ